jgi:hypothetical protein
MFEILYLKSLFRYAEWQSKVCIFKFPRKGLEPFVVRFLFGVGGEGSGREREVDRSRGIEGQEKAGYKVDAETVPG